MITTAGADAEADEREDDLEPADAAAAAAGLLETRRAATATRLSPSRGSPAAARRRSSTRHRVAFRRTSLSAGGRASSAVGSHRSAPRTRCASPTNRSGLDAARARRCCQPRPSPAPRPSASYDEVAGSPERDELLAGRRRAARSSRPGQLARTCPVPTATRRRCPPRSSKLSTVSGTSLLCPRNRATSMSARVAVELARLVELGDAPVRHDRDAVGELHRLRLVVRHVDRGEAEVRCMRISSSRSFSRTCASTLESGSSKSTIRSPTTSARASAAAAAGRRSSGSDNAPQGGRSRPW